MSVNDRGTDILVLFLGDQQGLEGGHRRQYRPPYPNRIFSFWRRQASVAVVPGAEGGHVASQVPEFPERSPVHHGQALQGE